MDELWTELKKHKDAGRGFLLNQAQLKILDAINVSSKDFDFNKLRKCILAVESLKDNGNYSSLEYDLESIDQTRKRYKEEKDKEYERIKYNMEKEVNTAIQKLTNKVPSKKDTVDMQSSIEASIRTNTEWKTFITQHNDLYNKKFKEHISAIREKLIV